MMFTVTKITARYRVTLPREVRQALKAKVGDLLVFIQQPDGSFRVQAVPPRLTHALRAAGKQLSPEDHLGGFQRGFLSGHPGWGMEPKTLQPEAELRTEIRQDVR